MTFSITSDVKSTALAQSLHRFPASGKVSTRRLGTNIYTTNFPDMYSHTRPDPLEEAEPESQTQTQTPSIPPPPPPPPMQAPVLFPINRERGRLRMMPLIPEEPEEMYSRWARSNGSARTQRVSPLTMYNFNNTDIINDGNNGHGTTNTHKRHNTNRDEDFKDYECCPECYGSQLVALCRFHNIPTEEIDKPEPMEEPVALEESVRPLESYVNETDLVIKKLLAEMAEREKVNSN